MMETPVADGGASSNEPGPFGVAETPPSDSVAADEINQPVRHRRVSFGRIGAICANTLTELTRMKVFYFLLLFGLLLIGGSVFLARFSFQQEFQILKDISLGAMSIFSSLLAI